MRQKEFVFVNKNPRSQCLTRAVGPERTLIFSHVRQSIAVRKRSSNQTTFAVSGAPHEDDATDGRDHSGSRLDTTERKLSPMTMFSNLLRQRGMRSDRYGYGSELSIERNIPLFNVRDPKIGPYVDVLLMFYESPLEHRIFSIQSMAGELKRCSLSLASQDPVVLYALLCNTAGAMCALSHSQEHYQRSEYFRYRAVCLLRQQLDTMQRLSEQICSPSTAYAVSLLLFIEGNVGAVEAHLIGLERLVALAGGIVSMPTQVIVTVLECSLLCCAMTQKQPAIRVAIPSRYHLQAATIEEKYRHELRASNTGSRFLTEHNARLLGKDLLETITEMRKCFLLRESYSSKCHEVSREEAEYLRLLELNVDHNLLSFNFEQTSGDDTSLAVRYGLRYLFFAFCQPVVHIAPSVSAFNRSVAQICSEVIDSIHMSKIREECSDLYLWILVIAAHIVQRGEKWSLFIERMASLVEELGLESIQQVEQVLLGFFWFPQYFRTTLESAWADCIPYFSNHFRQTIVTKTAPDNSR